MAIERSVCFLRRVGSFLLLTLFPLTAVEAQDSPKTVQWADHTNFNSGRIDLPWSRRIDAIELEAILIDGRSVLIGEPFVADIRDLTFRVKNISDAPVGFIQITLTLPEIKHSPEIPFVRVSVAGKTQRPLWRGEETELRIPDRALYDWVKEAVVKQGREFSSIKKAAIYSVLVVSEKGSQMTGGCLKTLDPRNACPFTISGASR